MSSIRIRDQLANRKTLAKIRSSVCVCGIGWVVGEKHGPGKDGMKYPK